MINKQVAIKNIVDMQRIVPKSFAVYGTALGMIRENDIIGHDLDTDVGIFSKDFDWSFVNELVKAGFTIWHIFGMRHYGMEISFRRDGVKTDLMIYYEKEDGTIWNSLWNNGGVNGLADEIRHEYKKELFKTQTVILAGHVISTLGVEYIKYVYGDEWKIPMTKWDWRTDHKCRVEKK